jgi:hypothetical protein
VDVVGWLRRAWNAGAAARQFEVNVDALEVTFAAVDDARASSA